MIDFEGRKIPNELSEIVEPSRTVLLVWDMQNDQAGGAFNKEALIRNAPPLIAAATDAGIKTVYTRQTPYLWNDESPAWIHRFMKEQKVDHPSKLKTRRFHGSFGWQIMEPFKPGANDMVIDKRRPTMFIGNEFETVLSNREPTTSL
jgi:nicotinamidase-related amidase